MNITVPTGTAANKDVPTSGNASTSQVVMGNDSRLTDSRNAKDVYSWAKASSKPTYTASEVGAIPTSAKGAANGVAQLDSAGKVPASQLPSYVDDVLEYNNKASFPTIGETGKIYIDKATNLTWRWGGSTYIEISPSLALGETSSTAYAGDKGKALADKLATIASGAEVNVQSDWNATSGDAFIKNKPTIPAAVTESTVSGWGFTKNAGTITGIKMNGSSKGTSGTVDLGTVITSHQDISGKVDKTTTVNGHALSSNVSVTKSDVGLGNVGNFKAVSTVASQGLTNTEKSNARANIGAGTSSFSGSYNDLSNKPTIPTNNNQLTNGAGYITSSGSITGNAGSATKLQTARTIWGQSFDGTGDVSGRLSLGGSSMYWKESGYGDQFAIVPAFNGTDDTNTLCFQSAVGDAGTTPNLSTKMVITGKNGNVGIGTTSPSKKLDVNGTLNVTGNATLTSINGVTVGSSPKFTDTTYSSQAAASGGTAVSLCTTGEKYTWNNKQAAFSNLSTFGSGIGTCATSSGTALAVTLSGYNLVKNGFVAVTFEHDVPANATLNINGKGAKAIYYKGSAITADTIKADDTVMFCYNGSQYVVTSLGGGGAAINPNETVNISLTQVGGSSADLIGASITITDDDSGDTLLITTWNGSMITTEIEVNTNYTVSVETIAGYLDCAPQSYQAGYQTERNISFQYRALGAFVEATDGTLYTASTWASSGKTANSVVLITSTNKFRVAITSGSYSNTWVLYGGQQEVFDPSTYGIITYSENSALQNYDGSGDTDRLWAMFVSKGWSQTDGIMKRAHDYTFPDGVTKGYLPSVGEAIVYRNNETAINQCASACGGFTSSSQYISTSTIKTYSSDYPNYFSVNSSKTPEGGPFYGNDMYRIFGTYE